MTAIVLFGGFIAGYRNINQKYPARKVETAEKENLSNFWMELKSQRME